jgi:hypothetical protein
VNDARRPRYVWVAGGALAFAWAAFCIAYVVNGRPPASFYTDLGADVLNVGQMGALATSIQNVFGMIGWKAWSDTSSFIYESMGQNFSALPFEVLAKNPFVTVKLFQVLLFTLAFVAFARLYRYLFGASYWEWLAAFAYTALPLSAFWIRGDLGYGFTVALVPVALLVNLELGRRFGARSFAAAAAVIGAATFAAGACEMILTVGIPLLFVSFALLRWKHGVRVSGGLQLLALAMLGIFASYVALPTILQPPVRSWLQTQPNTDLSLFSQEVVQQVGGILHGSTISPDTQQNASSSMPFYIGGGIVLWILAIAGITLGIRTKEWGALWPVGVAWLICFLLSFGPSLVFVGQPLWLLMGHVPVLWSLRTPERFAQLNALILALAAGYAAAQLGRRSVLLCVVAVCASLAVIVTYSYADSRQHVLALGSFDQRLPDFEAVGNAVTQAGGRAVTFAFPKNGSVLDFPPYVPTSPTVAFAWDVETRFSDGGTSILRRSAVNSIVTSPAWTVNYAAGMPDDMAKPFQASNAVRPIGPFSHGANVFVMRAPRAMVTSVHAMCALSGPDAFELAAGVPRFETYALTHDSAQDCSQTLYGDFDPRDETLPAQSVALWSGAAAFGESAPLPIQNAYEIDRFGIAARWYRNSYRGDSLITTQPFLTYGYASSALSFTVPRDDVYAIYVRMSGLAALQTSDPRRHIVVSESRRVEGFSWVSLPLGRLRPGAYKLPIELTDAPEADMPAVVDSVVVARTAPIPPAIEPPYTMVSLRAFEPPLAVRSFQLLFPRPNSGGVTASGQGVQLFGQTKIDIFGGAPRIIVTAAIGRLRFHWYGKTGRYVVAASGWFNEAAPTLELRTGGQVLRLRYDPSTGIAETTAYARMLLVHGAPIDVAMDARPGGSAALMKIIAMPIQPEETPTSYDDAGEVWEFGKADPLQFYESIHSSDIAIAGGAIRAFPGATAELPFDPVFVHGDITADVQVSGGKGEAELRCGSQSDRSDIGSGSENPGGAALVVERTQDVPCALSVVWKSETLTLESVLVHARGKLLANWSAQQYFARGTYGWSGARGVDLLVDGRSWPMGRSLALRAGQHLLTMRRAPADMEPLLFRRAGVTSPASPPAIDVHERSATSWSVRTAGPTILELAQFDDGNWYARTKSQTTFGYACDLVNTCFDVDAGDVYVSRRLPPILALGLTITILDVAVAIALLFLPELQLLWRRAVAARIVASRS